MQENAKKTKPLYRQNKDFTLNDLIRILWFKKWLIIACLIISIGIAFYIIKTAVPIYRANVLINRDMKYTSYGSMSNMMYMDFKTTANLQAILRSRSSLEEISNRLLTKHGYKISIAQLGGLFLVEDEESKMINLSVTANSPEYAQAIANAAVDVFIDKNAEIRKSELSQGTEFLKNQVDQVEEKMRETERALNSLRDREGLILTSPSDISGGLLGKLGEMQSEALKMESDVEFTKSQLKALESLIAEKKKLVRANSIASSSTQIDQLQERLINLQLDLSTKLETLTEKDPEIISLRKRIDATETQLQTEFNNLIQNPDTTIDPISELQNLTQQYIKLSVELKGLETREEVVNERLKKFREEHPEIASKQIELVKLERQSRIYEQSFASISSKYQEARLMEQMKGSGLNIVDYANMPRSPISPRKGKILTTAIILGLGIGLVITFFLEYIDDSIKTKEDVERFLELPVLGIISNIGPFNVPFISTKKHGKTVLPSPKKDKSKDSPSVVRVFGRKSNKSLMNMLSHSLIYSPNGTTKTPAVENYWNLAMSLKYINIDSPVKTLLVTSVVPGERKTTTASNLAIVKAKSGLRVLLIDADLRRPMIHRVFQQTRKPGLSDLLTIDNSMDNITFNTIVKDSIRTTTVENLFLLPCGSSIPNSDALLSSDKMRNLLNDLKEKFDLIIIDSAPLLVVANVVALSKEADGVLMVMNSGKTKRKLAITGKDILDGVNARIIGVALTGVDLARQYGYYYRRYYNYYYQHKDDDD